MYMSPAQSEVYFMIQCDSSVGHSMSVWTFSIASVLKLPPPPYVTEKVNNPPPSLAPSLLWCLEATGSYVRKLEVETWAPIWSQPARRMGQRPQPKDPPGIRSQPSLRNPVL